MPVRLSTTMNERFCRLPYPVERRALFVVCTVKNCAHIYINILHAYTYYILLKNILLSSLNLPSLSTTAVLLFDSRESYLMNSGKFPITRFNYFTRARCIYSVLLFPISVCLFFRPLQRSFSSFLFETSLVLFNNSICRVFLFNNFFIFLIKYTEITIVCNILHSDRVWKLADKWYDVDCLRAVFRSVLRPSLVWRHVH